MMSYLQTLLIHQKRVLSSTGSKKGKNYVAKDSGYRKGLLRPTAKIIAYMSNINSVK